MSERVYVTVDKSEWGDGPWQNEPDKVQFRDETTGLDCLLKRGPMGAWCGYVGVPPGHPLYEKDYNAACDEVGYDALDCHGGLTYSDHCAEGPEESSICHIPDPGEPDHVWWFGFDCAHSGDLVPSMEARNRQKYEETGDPLWLPIQSGGFPATYKTIDYVRRETVKLAAELTRVDVGERS